MTIRLLAPLSLLGLGLCLLVGCLYVPGSYKAADGRPKPEAEIGPGGSDKPLWVGRATRDDVIRVLGGPRREPFLVTSDRTLVYPYRVDAGHVLVFCGIAPPLRSHLRGERFLRLDFDDQGLLRAYKVFKDLDEAAEATL